MIANYEELKKQTNRGWNTWYSPSMTSHVRLPDGFCIALCFKDPSVRNVIRDLKPDDFQMRPGARSADGSYTELSFKPGDTEITVRSASVDGEQFIPVTPTIGGAAPTLIVEAQLLAQSSKCILLGEWLQRGHVYENYSGDDGSGCHDMSNSFYHWGGLLGYIAIMEL